MSTIQPLSFNRRWVSLNYLLTCYLSDAYSRHKFKYIRPYSVFSLSGQSYFVVHLSFMYFTVMIRWTLKCTIMCFHNLPGDKTRTGLGLFLIQSMISDNDKWQCCGSGVSTAKSCQQWYFQLREHANICHPMVMFSCYHVTA